jgi:hypothetical protein
MTAGTPPTRQQHNKAHSTSGRSLLLRQANGRNRYRGQRGAKHTLTHLHPLYLGTRDTLVKQHRPNLHVRERLRSRLLWWAMATQAAAATTTTVAAAPAATATAAAAVAATADTNADKTLHSRELPRKGYLQARFDDKNNVLGVSLKNWLRRQRQAVEWQQRTCAAIVSVWRFSAAIEISCQRIVSACSSIVAWHGLGRGRVREDQAEH